MVSEAMSLAKIFSRETYLQTPQFLCAYTLVTSPPQIWWLRPWNTMWTLHTVLGPSECAFILSLDTASVPSFCPSTQGLCLHSLLEPRECSFILSLDPGRVPSFLSLNPGSVPSFLSLNPGSVAFILSLNLGRVPSYCPWTQRVCPHSVREPRECALILSLNPGSVPSFCPWTQRVCPHCPWTQGVYLHYGCIKQRHDKDHLSLRPLSPAHLLV